jgi:hypothetical protein
MATNETVTDDFITRLSLQDDITAQAEAIAAALAKLTGSAEAAGKAVQGAGEAAGSAGAKVTAAAAAWERVAARQDAVTAATVKLKAAQEELVRVQGLAAAGLAKGVADPEVIGRVLAKQTEGVDKLKASLASMRDAQEAARQSNELWQAGLAEGDELLLGLATSAAATAAAFTKGSAEAAIFGQSLSSLRGHFDSVYSISMQYEKEFALLNMAFKTGAIEGPQAQARALDELNAKFEKLFVGTDTLAKKQADAKAAADAHFEAMKKDAQAVIDAGIAADKAAESFAKLAQASFNQTLGDPSKSAGRGGASVSGLGTPYSEADAAKRKDDIDAYAASLNDLQSRFDPLFAANLKFTEGTDALAKAIRLGLLPSIELQEEALARLVRDHEAAVEAIRGTAAAAEAFQQKANAFAGVGNRMSDAQFQSRGADLEAAFGSTSDTGRTQLGELDAARAKYDEVYAASMRYAAAKKELDLASPFISTQRYNTELDKLNAGLAKGTVASSAYAGGHGQAAFATRQLGVQTVQFFSSLESGIPFMTALVEQGHQLVDVALSTGTGFDVVTNAIKKVVGWFGSPLGAGVAAVGALTAGLGAMALATEHSNTSMLTLQQTLRATHEDYAALAKQAEQAASKAAATSPVGRAEGLAAAGNILSAPNSAFAGSTEDIAKLVSLSKDLATVMGVTVPEAADKFIKKAIQEPGKAAEEFAQKHLFGMTDAMAQSIKEMELSGNAGDAYNAVLERMKTVSGSTADAMTPLGRAMDSLLQKFASVKKEGDGITAPQGGLSRLATVAVESADALVDKLQKMGSGHDPNSAQALLPYGGTQEQLAAKTPTPDQRLPGLTDAMKQMAVDATKAVAEFNKTFEATVDLISKSPFGKLDEAKASVTGLEAAIAKMGTSTGGTAEQTAVLEKGLRIAQKTFDEATIAADNFFKTATDKAVEASEANTKGQNEIANAYAQGDYAVLQATAHAKAYEAEIAQGQSPATQKFTDDVDRLTTAYLNNASAIASVKAMEDSRNILGQIEVIKAETEAIYANTAANRAAVQAAKDKQLSDKLTAAGASPNAIAEVLAQQTSLEYYAGQKALASQAVQSASHSKPADIEKLTAQNREYRAELDKVGERTTANAAKYDQLTAGINGNNDAIAKLEKGTASHTSALSKQTDKVLAQIDATKALETAYLSGNDAVVDINAKLQAQEKLIADGLTPASKNWKTELEKMTAEYKQLGVEQANLKAIQETKDIQQQIDLIKLETDTLLENSNAREAAIQHKKDEYEVNKNNMSLDPARRAALLAEKDALEQLTQQLNDRKATASYLASQFSSAFDTIGNSITDAFVKGSGSAVKWGSVMQGVLSQVVQQFAHLAILNPIMNSLFGQNQPTLGSVASLLSGGSTTAGGGAGSVGGISQLINVGGQLFSIGGGGATTAGGGAGSVSGISPLIGTQAVGSGPGIGSVFGGGAIGGLAGLYASGAGQGAAGGGAGSSASSLLSNAGTLFSVGKALFPDTFSLGGSGSSIFGNLGESLGLTGESGALSGVTSFLNTPLVVSSQAGPVTSGLAAGGAGLPGTVTLGGVIGAAGAGYGAGSLIGSYVQGATGKTGPGPEVGAALGTAIGIGAVALAPATFGTSLLVGALIGGSIGGAAGGLIGPKAPSAFSSTMVTTDAQGLLQVGGTTAQRVNASGERAAAIGAAAAINDMLTKGGLRVSSLEGANTGAPYLQIGQNTPGGFQDPSKHSDFGAAFPFLRFSSSDQLTNQFIQGRLFQSPEELGGVTTSLRDFENALKGTKAESDTAGIAMRALAGAANTDVQPALQKAATFITATFPTLTQGNRGSLAVAQDQVTAQYGEALGTAQQLGFGYDDLLAARQKLYEKNQIAANQQIDATAASVNTRYFAARANVTGSRDDALTSQLVSFDTQAKQAHQQLSQTLLGIWGDAAETSADYQNRMAEDDKATAEERLAILTAFNKQTETLMKASYEQLETLRSRATTSIATLSGDPHQIAYAQQVNLQRTQAAELRAYTESEKQTFGDAFQSADPNYYEKLGNLMTSQTYEMAQLNQTIARQNLNLQIASTRQDQGLTVRSAAASAALYPTAAGAQAAYYKFDVAAQQETQDFYTQARDSYGDAYTVSEEYYRKLNNLIAVQGQERLVLEQTLNQRLRQQAISSWQQDIGFTTRRDTARAAISRDPIAVASASLSALYVQQVEEMQNLKEGLASTYGDAYTTTAEYYGKVGSLQEAQTAEMQSAQQTINRQLRQLTIDSANQNAGFAQRYQTAHAAVTGSTADKNAAALAQQDEAAREELTNLYLSLTNTYGDAYALTAEYGDKINALVKAQGEERLELEKQQQDALTSTAEASIASLVEYSKTLQTSDKSPLSPLAQLDLAKSQFQTQSGLASSGDYGAIQTLQNYSETYLAAAHTVYGSGIDYVKAFSEVISTLADISTQTPDMLTASVLQQETRSQTAILVEQLQELKDEVVALRLQVAQGTSAPARVS